MSIRNMYNSFNIQLDPYWDKVVSLLHFEGTSVYDTIVDEKGNSWGKNGNLQLSTDNKKFGARSLQLGESGFSCIYSNSSKYTIGLNDFCIEFFFKANAIEDKQALFSMPYYISGNYYTLSLEIITGYLFLKTTNYSSIYTEIESNIWYHVALVRNNIGYLHLYLDGTLVSSFQFYDNFNSSPYIYIGTDEYYGSGFVGYIDEFRFTNGEGRYISGFSPPTAPFPNF